MSRRKTRGRVRVQLPAVAGYNLRGEERDNLLLPLLTSVTSIAQTLGNVPRRGNGSKKRATARKQSTPRRRAPRAAARPATSVQNAETITLDDVSLL